ncbi:hypothetical protein GGI11_002986, partial [Coemansia sp. RSA 2049]
MIAHWTTGDPASHQYGQPSNAAAGADTAGYNSPPDTPLVKIVQQQQQRGDMHLGAQPTPPLSASSHGMGPAQQQQYQQHPASANSAATDAWRTYHAASYHHGIP